MKILRCIICNGEVDILDSNETINKKIKCRKCGFTNGQIYKQKEPEIVVIRRKHNENNSKSLKK